MKCVNAIQGLAVCLAAIGVCLPQPLVAASIQSAPTLIDVELQKGPQGDVLLGQVQDQQGAVQAKVPVILYGAGNKVAETTTDADGYFTFHNVRGGVYQLTSAEGVGTYRVWQAGTAPPTAQPGALVVAGEDVARGNWHQQGGRLKFWLSHPLVIAGIVAAAVAIPVAIHNSRDRGETPTSP